MVYETTAENNRPTLETEYEDDMVVVEAPGERREESPLAPSQPVQALIIEADAVLQQHHSEYSTSSDSNSSTSSVVVEEEDEEELIPVVAPPVLPMVASENPIVINKTRWGKLPVLLLGFLFGLIAIGLIDQLSSEVDDLSRELDKWKTLYNEMEERNYLLEAELHEEREHTAGKKVLAESEHANYIACLKEKHFLERQEQPFVKPVSPLAWAADKTLNLGKDITQSWWANAQEWMG